MLFKMWHEIICVITRRIICKWSAIKPFQICLLATPRVLHLCYPESLYSSHTHKWSWRSSIITVGDAPVFECRHYRVYWYVLFLTHPKFHLLVGRWHNGSKHTQACKKTWIQLAQISFFLSSTIYNTTIMIIFSENKISVFVKDIISYSLNCCPLANQSHVHKKVEGAKSLVLH